MFARGGNVTGTAAAKVETVSLTRIVQMIQVVSIWLIIHISLQTISGNGILDLVTGIWTKFKLGTEIWQKFGRGTKIWYPPS